MSNGCVVLNKYENSSNERGQAKEKTISLACFCVRTDKKREEVPYDGYVLVSIERLVSLNHFLLMSEVTVRFHCILLFL
ncbi:hypothetical protein COM08_03170 [Bacillus wiedmannii]|uniref:Uncharacterized protein n=1 Tax=Bacillus wiedmannii TaxID=1890302 RepID=A0A2B6RQG2_9BACI|nr:hypothetical protein COL51_25265 [Bacillus wiedmannii]PGC21688.1 hypothetical protein COM08_03170 [Bacillus wiedmannii]PGC60598.1 hypothetical protein COM22_01430 [Bacillus wiedmannii]PGD30745.1 hypothetical protein COM27_23680 [Bacillus wiedmannii]PHE69043.1 hypothetical protein COF77_29075 [Bacillus wiedmannii]